MDSQHRALADQPYPLPTGSHVIPDHFLDLRPDSEIDQDLVQFKPVSSEKNVWFFWDNGYGATHPASKRTIRAWHRRFSKHGWTIRIVDRLPGSPSNITNFVEVADPELFPRAFVEGTMSGQYVPQWTADLIRWPLILKHGGVWADIGLIQIGDLDRLWSKTVGDPDSGYEMIAYGSGNEGERHINNYFMAAGRDNAFFKRCLRLLLALWAADGGSTNQDGMHANKLLKEVPLVGANLGFSEDVQRSISDYVTQIQVMTMVMGLVDAEDGWDGPAYMAKHAYAIDYLVGSSLYNEMTDHNGTKQFELMSLALPKDGEVESTEQQKAREIVEMTLQKSFGFKLAHGMLITVVGVTLGALWRQHEGSDNIRGTFAHWIRHAATHCSPDQDPPPLDFSGIKPIKIGPLLRES